MAQLESYVEGEIREDRITEEEKTMITDDDGMPLLVVITLYKLTFSERKKLNSEDLQVKLYLNCFSSCYVITISISGVVKASGAFTAGTKKCWNKPPVYRYGEGREVAVIIIDGYNGETVAIKKFMANTRFSNALINAKNDLINNPLNIGSEKQIAESILARYSNKELINKTNVYTEKIKENIRDI